MSKTKTIKELIIKSLKNIDIIIEEEPFSAYLEVKKSLISALDSLDKNDYKPCIIELSHSFRLLREAPPKDDEIGYEILSTIDTSFKLLSESIDQFGKI